MKKRKGLAVLLALAMGVLPIGCAKSGETEETTASTTTAATEEESIVNIGTTDTWSSVNPLLMDATEILKYSLGLEFLPLVELDSDLEFQGQLATSITTEDNIHFTVNIDPDATWSDGEPITAEDVVFTVLKLGSKTLGNVNMALYAFEGFGDDGYLPDGATEAEGVKAIDDKTVEFTTKYEMALTTFENTYGRYILTLPKHVLENVEDSELASYEWFSSPTVVSGPYILTEYDLQHYMSFTANTSYWKGTPNIEKLNFKVLTSAQLYTGLQSGEIDLVQQTTGVILNEDYANVEALDNVTAVYGSPVTNQSIFFNTTSITDARIRQAMLYGIDRETILEGVLNGNGEVVDGFLSSASPFYSDEVVPVSYDPDKAKALVEEAVADGYDTSKSITFYVNSGDTTFTQVADYYVAQWKEIGLNVEVRSVDIASLLDKAGTKDYDILAVQYTYAPVDPYPDINWLLSADGWTGYVNDTITEALAGTQSTSDVTEIQALYKTIDLTVQEDVPMMSAYIISALGAVSNRLENASPNVYGTFINVEDWNIK